MSDEQFEALGYLIDILAGAGWGSAFFIQQRYLTKAGFKKATYESLRELGYVATTKDGKHYNVTKEGRRAFFDEPRRWEADARPPRDEGVSE